MSDTAWTDVYTEFRPKLERYINQHVNDPVVAEDLTAQVFVKALAAEQQGAGAHSNQTGWLYRIAHNLVIDHYRERDRRPTVALTDEHPTDDDPQREALAAVNRAALDRAIARLPGDQGAVVRLRLDGFAFDEIANVLNNTTSAVKALQHRAWAGLRRLLSSPATTQSLVDHVVPLSRGGADDAENIVISCPTCNLHKHNKLPHEWLEGNRLP